MVQRSLIALALPAKLANRFTTPSRFDGPRVLYQLVPCQRRDSGEIVDGFSGIVGPGFNTVDRDVRLVTVLQHYAISDCSKEQFVHHPITSPIQGRLGAEGIVSKVDGSNPASIVVQRGTQREFGTGDPGRGQCHEPNFRPRVVLLTDSRSKTGA
jgi:hypothetical protein